MSEFFKGRNVTKVSIGYNNYFELSTLVLENGEIEYLLWDNEGEPVPVIEWALGVALVSESKYETIIGTKNGVFHPAIGSGEFFATLIALATRYHETQF